MSISSCSSSIDNMYHPPIFGAADNENNILNLLLRSYKFYPDDTELIEYYLKAKISGDFIVPGLIHDVNVYKHSPQQLNDKYIREGEQYTYFFTPRSRKYPNGNRPDRVAGDFGFWKASGSDIPIRNNNTIIGFKRNLVFHEGKPINAVKTNWLMQEFTLNKDISDQHKKNLASSIVVPPCKMLLDDWVLCKIYKNKHKRINEDIKDVNKRRREREIIEKLNEDKRERENIKEVAISTNVAATLHYQPNQYSHAQHLQIPFSSYSPILGSNIYPNSFLPHYDPSLPVLPLDDGQMDFVVDTLSNLEEKDFDLLNQFLLGPLDHVIFVETSLLHIHN